MNNGEWQLEIKGIPDHPEYEFITDWAFVGDAFQDAGWKKHQGSLEYCIAMLHWLHPNWQQLAQFRIRSRITNEVIPLEILL